MLNHTTVRAESVDEAIEKGLAELELTRDQADIHVISEGKKGFLGFGKQYAIVEISKKTDLSLKDITAHLEQTEADEVTVTTEPSEPAPLQTVEEAIETEEIIVNEPTEEHVVQEVKVADKVEEQATELEEVSDADEPKEVIREEATLSRFDNEDDAVEEVAHYLVDVIDVYGAEGAVEYEIDGRNVFFDIHTDKSGLIIGRHGKIINSLQVLAQTYLLSLFPKHMNVVLNVGDYRKRRAKVLQQMAEEAAEKAIATQKPQPIRDLPAYERKQIHRFLSSYQNIQTYSQGREPKRQLVIDYKES